jgi:hypothetical protein
MCELHWNLTYISALEWFFGMWSLNLAECKLQVLWKVFRPEREREKL